MRSFFILFIFLTLTLEASAVNKLKQGESYSGTLTKLYINSNAVALPPGLWKVTERDTERGHWEFESATLKHKDGSEIYLRLSKSRDNQIRWLGNIGWFDGCSWGTVWAKGKGQVHHASKGKSYWCVIKDGSWISFYNTKMARKLITVIYHFPSNIIDMNKSNAERYGKLVYEEFLKGFKGKKSADLNFLSTILNKKKSSSSSSSNYNDLILYPNSVICNRATKNDGSWDYRTSGSIKAVDTAKSRNLSLENCSKLTGRKSSLVPTEEKEESTIEQKLKKLKKLLSDGLIAQEDYNKKKAEYLENF